ncbi:hypothetical protein LIER_07763 [Lithospermum erythrorhizon]|uniref:Uncharacterized protein n=1 Tax=Lithospermum erythrorhizon TaxID=34254 RepID=A0AAV3PAR9_LITER
MESNVDTSAIDVSATQNVHVASDVQNVPAVDPGGGFGLTSGVILPPFVPAVVVPTVPASGVVIQGCSASFYNHGDIAS